MFPKLIQGMGMRDVDLLSVPWMCQAWWPVDLWACSLFLCLHAVPQDLCMTGNVI